MCKVWGLETASTGVVAKSAVTGHCCRIVAYGYLPIIPLELAPDPFRNFKGRGRQPRREIKKAQEGDVWQCSRGKQKLYRLRSRGCSQTTTPSQRLAGCS